jgi:hypothetical protein
MSDRWIEGRLKIEKAAVVAGPLPPPRPYDPLDAIFGSDTEDITPVEKTAQIFDDGTTDIPSGVEQFFEKSEKDKFRIPEVIVEPVHPDGVFMEKTDGGVFKFTYEHGRLIRSELFDENGVHKGSVEESPVPDLIVKTELAAILGLREQDQVEVETGE